MSQRIVALDSIRGFLLILMTLDHLGGPIAKKLYGSLGFVSAAEGFFFLSGFVAIKVCLKKTSASQWLLQRMRTIWLWHILSLLVITILSITLSSWGWKHLSGTTFLFQDPLTFALCSISLLNLPDYLDVLPLYVIFMGFAAFIIPCVQKSKFPATSLFLFSTILYLFSQQPWATSLRNLLPDWINTGAFNPFAWQFIFFSGAALSLSPKQEHPWWQKNIILVMALILALLLMAWKQDLLGIPHPSETQFWNSRSLLGPLRIFNTAVYVILFSSLIHKFPKLLFGRFPALLGRNSLYVFAFHLPLVYLWLYRPFSAGTFLSIGIPILVVFSLAIPALLHEKS